MRIFSLVVCGLLLFGILRGAHADDLTDLVVPQTVAEQHGLVRAWMAQVSVSGDRGQIKYVVLDEDLLFVQTSDAMLYAIDTETGRTVWSTEVGDARYPSLRPSANGPAPRVAATTTEVPAKAPADAAGGDAAAPAAAAPAAVAPAAAAKKRVTTAAVAASLKSASRVVAVVNGTDLYLLDRRNGQPHADPKSGKIWKASLRSPPVAGPLVSEEAVYVPTASGVVEVYFIDDLLHVGDGLGGTGKCSYPPILSGTRVAWGSDTGFVHISVLDGLSVKYRIPLGGPIEAPLSARPPRVFAGSLDTSLYCFNDGSGATLWRFTTGSPIRQMPVVIGSGVFVAPEDGGMFRLAALDGRQEWFNPTAHSFLAASATHVYALDSFQRLAVLDAATGASLDLMPLPSAVLGLVNSQSDRVFFSSREGLLQCLHETGRDHPLNHLRFNPEEGGGEAAPNAAGPPLAIPPPDPTLPPADADKAAEK